MKDFLEDHDVRTPMPPGGRRKLDAYLRILNRIPGARAMWDATGNKRLFLGGCLICDAPDIVHAGIFSPHPGAVPALDGRVAFYALCPSHAENLDHELVEARLEFLSKLPQ